MKSNAPTTNSATLLPERSNRHRALAQIPPDSGSGLPPIVASTLHVLLDFDGTITAKDVLDELIFKFAGDDSWKQVEVEWQAGRIGSRECLTREFDCVRVTPGELAAFLKQIPIDPGLVNLLSLLRREEIEFAILSDGIELFIRTILARAGAGEITIRSNAIEHKGDRVKLVCPHSHGACTSAAAHCKCASAQLLTRPEQTLVYVGDGRSDLCPARKCDIVFAKGALARHLEAEGLPFYRFDTLNDVARALAGALVTEAAA